MNWRKRIYQEIEIAEAGDRLSAVYDYLMMVAILLSPVPLAIVDLVSILPSVLPVSSGLKFFRLLRLVHSFRVFRAFKMLRYSKSMTIRGD